MSRIQECPFEGKDKGKKPEVEEIELSLSLSLNGKFGVDRNAKGEKRALFSPQLVRTCSVQVENEGEIQVIKKMAKRKRMERMSIVRGVRERIEGHGNEVNCNVYGRGVVSRNENDLVNPYLGAVVEESDEGSSPGCGSSEVSDNIGHQTMKVLNKSSKARSGSLSPPEQNEQGVALIHGIVASPSVGNRYREMSESKKKAVIKAMASRGWHYVFTTLDGPNHVKVEGFLQKFNSGQPVKIVCFCHGVHHSPAEFVKHGGGDAVENPLKHIVVILPSEL